MGKVSKFYSSTGWEDSSFGGFSRILWDLPEMQMPYGFDIKCKEEIGYMSSFTERKILALFLYKLQFHKLTDVLLEECALKSESTESYFGYVRNITFYEFSKVSVKRALSLLIGREMELKSLFIHYSNLLSNSTIVYEIPQKDLDSDTFDSKNASGYLSKAISQISERKSYSYWKGGTIASVEDLKKDTVFNVFHDSVCKDLIFTDEENDAANKLVDMLDISFELGCSKITSLRSGKLDISKLAEALSGNSHIYYKEEMYERTKPFSVCILCDESGSMRGSKFNKQHTLVKIMYKAFSQILPPEKLYIYGHTGDMSPIINVYQDKYNPYFEKSFSLQYSDHVDLEQNYDGPVTDVIYEKIRSYTNDNILFIVLSDGEPSGYDYGSDKDFLDFKRIIEKCKRDGFVTCGIGIEYFRVQDLYQYSTVIKNTDDPIKNVSLLINNVVKSEFQ